MEIQKALETLERIAQSFPQESQEAKAVEAACNALLFVEISEKRRQFEHFIATKSRPLNGLELIQLKVYGIDIPEGQRTSEIVELASEIDILAAKLLIAGKAPPLQSDSGRTEIAGTGTRDRIGKWDTRNRR
jgi:hypothetical protein